MFSSACTCVCLYVCACMQERLPSPFQPTSGIVISPSVSDVSAPCRPCCSPSRYFSLLSGNLFTRKTCRLLHMYVLVCLLEFDFMCVSLPVRQVEVKYLWLLSPPPFCLLPERNKLVPDVLLTITPRSFLTSPPFLCLFILRFLI